MHPESSVEANPELESFREQWRAEVRAKNPAAGPSQQQQRSTGTAGPSNSTAPGVVDVPRKPPPPPTKKSAPAARDHDEDHVPPPSFDHLAVPPLAGAALGNPGQPGNAAVAGEPVSALDHYERAVEREAAGKLGDSLSLYRKAFRMDDRVDQKYRSKHFPKAPPKPAGQAAPVSVVTPAKVENQQAMQLKDLIASFADLAIQPAAPEIEGMPQPPCPLAALPEEILVHILRDVAISDVGDFVRLAQVCKRLAYLVATEDQIWRRICLGSEFGFGGMHYHWQRQVAWEPLTAEDLLLEASEYPEGDPNVPFVSFEQRAQKQAEESAATTLALYRSLYNSSWQRMVRLRPRIRFGGCYISTVNYIRAGQANSNQVTWNSPVHIVTYYRYLRFFRDGTVFSLLSTSEPADVVHHLTRPNVALHAGGAMAHLPSRVVDLTLKGRWRLAHAGDKPDAPANEIEGDVIVETEGVSKYIYRLDLSLGSAGKGLGPRNNKLTWRGFYSYNRLTEDWAEFPLRNNKPFFFSRVKSYGVRGE